MDKHPLIQTITYYDPALDSTRETSSSLLVPILTGAVKEFYYTAVECTRYLFFKKHFYVGQVPTNVIHLYLSIQGAKSLLTNNKVDFLRYNVWLPKVGYVSAVEISVHRNALLWFLQEHVEGEISEVRVLWIDELREETLVWSKLAIPRVPEVPLTLPHKWSIGVSTTYCPFCLYQTLCRP